MCPIQIFKALGDSTRMAILQHLLTESCCVGALAAVVGVTEGAVSQQLKILREAGLVCGEKRGHYMHYAVCQQVLQEAGEWLLKAGNQQPGGCHGGCRHSRGEEGLR